ncbi:MAG: hypothetical protein EOS58_25555 [Mesorhizobium sp.]|nr:MAG: hypothetical protein EOS58_25555 [Mesorhizobium sp.]
MDGNETVNLTFKSPPEAQGPWRDLALHTLGWKAFQDLCAHVCEDVFQVPLETYREAQDGGQDAVFLGKPSSKIPGPSVIQCKFSSSATRSLRYGDISTEERTIEGLVESGSVNAYILITSLSVSGVVAIKLKERLRQLGVSRPYIFGKEFLVRIIRNSSRLRALVPRVYGLGDLSSILDQRKAAQTKALLGHMFPTLKLYVPTRPHVRAVRALSKHNIVLLLGAPATGKSTIAAILATIAADHPLHRSYKADGPTDLIANWNPDEGGGFYWIDDAFGPNQLREDFVDHWVSIMPKVQAAVAAGNSFVLTSRSHIYKAAISKLGSRNHPLFRDGEAIVDVGSLTTEERQQILYNHVKFGDQSKPWKRAVKPFLEGISKNYFLTPEICRRLGNPAYTKSVSLNGTSIASFVNSNEEYLLQTIKELSVPHRAALALVFLHRGKMPVGSTSSQMDELVAKHYGVGKEELSNALMQLKDTFLVEKLSGSDLEWSFKHPTLSDAFAKMLSEMDGMRELYLRGVRVEAILNDVLCAGMPNIRDAVIIPPSMNNLLSERISEIDHDDAMMNRALYSFLAERASDELLRAIGSSDRDVFKYRYFASMYAKNDPKIIFVSRANALGILPKVQKEEVAERLLSDIFDDLDTSFLCDETIMALLSPGVLLGLAARLRDVLFNSIEVAAEELAENPDLDLTPEENLRDLEYRLGGLLSFFELIGDDRGLELSSDARVSLDATSTTIQTKQAAKEQESDYDWEWESEDRSLSPPSPTKPQLASVTRSLFSDVDD